MPQKRPQKSRPQIQKGLLNQKASGKKLSVVQGFSAEKALQEKLPDVQAFPYSVLNKGYLLNQKASGEKLSTLRTGLSGYGGLLESHSPRDLMMLSFLRKYGKET